ncbi:MAG TPA: hypothetical protein VFF06_15555 [Polyangia bacterium]|nr:hypothetical protein [Polyangia bacterium]
MCAIGFAGCAPDSSPDGASFNRTIVVLHPDGTQDVRTEQITVEQQQTEIAVRAQRLQQAASGVGVAQQALTQDTGCAGSSMWLFDQATLTGNEICFTGQGYANFSSYFDTCYGTPPRCNTWATSVRSFWSGFEGGYFIPSSGPAEFFYPYVRVDSADSIVQQARLLCLEDNYWTAPTFCGG